jgi:hypothetical protein
MKLTTEDRGKIVHSYNKELIPAIQLAKQFNVTRASIYYVLRDAGVNTSKQIAAHIITNCTFCNKPILKIRCQYRKTANPFCNRACFFSWLNRTRTRRTPRR